MIIPNKFVQMEKMRGDEASQDDVIFYPNPISNQVIIELVNGFQKGAVVTLTDDKGRILEQLLVWETQCVIDFSNVSAGIYFVQVSNDTKSITRRIVKE